MKANELRIGNLVSYRGETDCIVSNLGNAFEASKTVGLNFQPYGSDDIEEYKPIPLTEEWLIKFRFNIKESIWFSKNTKIPFIRFEVCLKYKRCIFYNVKSIIFCDIKFTKSVHQLQNLYFALTGEELTINNA